MMERIAAIDRYLQPEPDVYDHGEAPEEPKGLLSDPTDPASLRSDIGNAARFASQHHDDLRYCPGLGWLRWDGKRWKRDDDGEVMRCAKDTALALFDEALEELRKAQSEIVKAKQAAAAAADDLSDSAKTRLAQALQAATRLLAWAQKSQGHGLLKAMIALAESDLTFMVHVEELDADPMLLNCLNGTIDLRTGELREHRRGDLITKLAPVDYDPAAEHTTWTAYLQTVTDGAADFASYLQRWAGYCLTGRTDEEQVAILLGPAATGKTTFVEAMSAAMGDYAMKASFATFLEQRNPGAPRPDLARLPGVRLVTACEASAGGHLDAVALKELAGGDTVTVRTLYKEPFSFKPACKIVLASNEAPRVSDQDTGVWRRLRRLPFEHEIAEGRRDPAVKASLCDPTQGGPAVLAWAVAGCLAWQRDGLGQCEAVRQRTQELRAEMDPLAEFYQDQCTFGASFETPARELREAYIEWCKSTGVRKPISNNEWGSRLKARGCEEDRVSHCGFRVRVWRGIGLLQDEEAA